MGLSTALNTTISGLRAAQRDVQVVSGNIANQGVDGYTRKRTVTDSFVGSDTTLGVRTRVTRELDLAVQRQLRTAVAGAGYAETRAAGFQRLDQMMGKPGTDGALDTAHARFVDALDGLAASPSDPAARASVIADAGLLASRLNQLTTDVQSLRSDAEEAIAAGVARVNELVGQLETLNFEIAGETARGIEPVGMYDARDRLVDDIARYIDLRVEIRSNGTAAVSTTGGISLLDVKASRLEFDARGTLTAEATWTSDPMTSGVGSIRIVTQAGNRIDLIADGQLRSGELAAQVELRDRVYVEAQNQLDAYAAALATALAPQTVAGTPNGGGFELDLSALRAGSAITLDITDASGPRRMQFVPGPGGAAAPVPNASAAPGDRIVAIDMTGGAAAVAARIQAVLGGAFTVSNPSGEVLSVAGSITAMQGTDPSYALLNDGGGTAYAGTTSPGAPRTGFAGRIAVADAVVADPRLLVQWTTGAGQADPTRPKALVERLEGSSFSFGVDTGIGAVGSPYVADAASFLRQVVAQRGAASETAARTLEGQEIVVSNLQARLDASSAVDIDEEMARLISLQSAYAANARVMSAVREMFDVLMRS